MRLKLASTETPHHHIETRVPLELTLAPLWSSFLPCIEVDSSNREAKIILSREIACVEVIPTWSWSWWWGNTNNTLVLAILLEKDKHIPVDPYNRHWDLIACQLISWYVYKHPHPKSRGGKKENGDWGQFVSVSSDLFILCPCAFFEYFKEIMVTYQMWHLLSLECQSPSCTKANSFIVIWGPP